MPWGGRSADLMLDHDLQVLCLNYVASLASVSSLAAVCASWKAMLTDSAAWSGHVVHLHRESLSVAQLHALGRILRHAQRVYTNMGQVGSIPYLRYGMSMSVYWHQNALWNGTSCSGQYLFLSSFSLPAIASMMVHYPAGCEIMIHWGLTSARDVVTMRNALGGVWNAGAHFLGQSVCISEYSRKAYPTWFQDGLPFRMPQPARAVAYVRSGGQGRYTDLTLKRRRRAMEFHVNGVLSGSLSYDLEILNRLRSACGLSCNIDAVKSLRYGLVVQVRPAGAVPVCYTIWPTPVEWLA